MNTAPSDPTRAASTANDGIVSSGWLANTTTFGEHDDRRIKRAFGATVVSSILHGVLLLIILGVLASGAVMVQDEPPPIVGLVYLNDPGPGGGGGGSPAPAPPREISIPAPKPAEPIPIEVPPPPVEPPPPVPRLTAPVMTPDSTFVQASGNNPVSLTSYGGGGRGRGVGSGEGDGVGPGRGGGAGGGVYGPGSGVTNPAVLKEVRPNYTSEAMRQKIQGAVMLDIIILADGTVDPGSIRITKSLDRVHGLDEEARKAARQWLFRPARDKDGKAVPFRAELQLDFRLH